MPDPNWTAEYNTGQDPVSNGFTLNDQGAVVNLVTSGNPSQRRVEINSDSGSAIYLTSDIPSLDPTIGVTVEAEIEVSGAGDAGFEMTFLDGVALCNVYENMVNLSMPSGTSQPNGQGERVDNIELDIPTASNVGKTIWRGTFDSNRDWRVYRNGVLVAGPISAHFLNKPFQRILFWGEGSGVQSFYEMRYFIGGAVAP